MTESGHVGGQGSTAWGSAEIRNENEDMTGAELSAGTNIFSQTLQAVTTIMNIKRRLVESQTHQVLT